MSVPQKWISLEKGIRYREHNERKHGKKFDRYYVLRFTVDGKKHQEALGWASEGVTLEKARIELAKLREAHRTGEGAQTLTEKKNLRREEKRRQEKEALLEKIGSVSVGDFWKDTYWQNQSHKAAGSLEAENALWIKWIAPAIKDIPLKELSEKDLLKLKNTMMKAQKSPATIKYAMAVVSQLWNTAFRGGLVTGLCPTKTVQLPKKDNRRQRYLSKEEATELLLALQQHSQQSYELSIIALDCGLRFGEIATLTWADCDFERETLLIRDPKAYSSRYAFMTARVKKLLMEKSTVDYEKAALIFYDTNGNKLARISNTFRKTADRLFNEGITDSRQKVCFHTLRHTFASRLAENGVSLYEIKELMGHSDFSMTQRYSHLSPEGLRNAIKILEE